MLRNPLRSLLHIVAVGLSVGALCGDTCGWANDGECDDGGEGSAYSVCDLGTDCTDCGPR